MKKYKELQIMLLLAIALSLLAGNIEAKDRPSGGPGFGNSWETPANGSHDRGPPPDMSGMPGMSDMIDESTVIISARKRWQDTGIKLRRGETVIISYKRGYWKISPSHKYYTGAGHSKSEVRSRGYVVKGVNEGALCGKIGKDGEAFYIGNTKKIVAEEDGTLYLIANDDIHGKYGSGFKDNSGKLEYVIYRLGRKEGPHRP